MSFCPECNTLLNHVEEDNKLYLNCRTCGFKEENKNSIISKKIYKYDESQIVGSKEYLIHDNTLPRTTIKKCVNEECPSRKNSDLQDIVFMTDSKTLKLHYICAVCLAEWNAA